MILDRVLPARSGVYVEVIEDQVAEGQIDNALAVWDRLYAMHPVIPMTDAFRLIMTMRATGRNQEAHRVWEQAADLAGLGNLDGTKNSAIWDGGFESDVMGPETYSWQILRNARSVQIGCSHIDKSLHV